MMWREKQIMLTVAMYVMCGAINTFCKVPFVCLFFFFFFFVLPGDQSLVLRRFARARWAGVWHERHRLYDWSDGIFHHCVSALLLQAPHATAGLGTREKSVRKGGDLIRFFSIFQVRSFRAGVVLFSLLTCLVTTSMFVQVIFPKFNSRSFSFGGPCFAFLRLVALGAVAVLGAALRGVHLRQPDDLFQCLCSSNLFSPCFFSFLVF